MAVAAAVRPYSCRRIIWTCCGRGHAKHVQNQENINEIMLRFEGREEELRDTICFMQDLNMVRQRALAVVLRTAILEARTRAHTILAVVSWPQRSLVLCGQRPSLGRRRPPSSVNDPWNQWCSNTHVSNVAPGASEVAALKTQGNSSQRHNNKEERHAEGL